MRPRLLVAAPAAAVVLVALSVESLAGPSPGTTTRPTPAATPYSTATPYATPTPDATPTPYSTATPYQTPTPESTLPREEAAVRGAIEGNATTCQQAGLPGELIHFISGPTSSFNATISGTVTDSRVLDIQVIDNAVITGVVVDGGPAYNVYTTGPFVGLTPPVDPQTNIQEIKHWMVCGWDLGSRTRRGVLTGPLPAHVPAGAADAGSTGRDSRIAPANLDTGTRAATDGPSLGLVALAVLGVASLVAVGAMFVSRRQRTDEA
jgi:hypothetical protein